MSTGTVKSRVRIILDTNIIISAIGFGGKPRNILKLILDKKIWAFTSSILLAELEDVINKKFPELSENFERTNKQIRKKFKIVRPKKSLHIVNDEDDNRVLEAAVEGECNYIITGDKELLNLGSFKEIKILTADQFLRTLDIISYSNPRLVKNS